MRNIAPLFLAAAATVLFGCASAPHAHDASAATASGPNQTDQREDPAVTADKNARSDERRPSAAIAAWMARLTVAHEWDPQTGFIVARENITLPPVLAKGPRLDAAVAQAAEQGLPLIVFATADRCAPCQQYRKDAINDARVVALLESGRFIAAHVEVDREGESADRHLGSRGIPMTYRLEAGTITARLPGQRSADELLEWLGDGTEDVR